MGSGVVATRSQHGFPDLDWPLAHRLFFDDDATLALDSSGHPRAHGQGRVGGVDDGVHIPVGDVAALDGDAGGTDPDFHTFPWAALSVSARAARSRALTAVHASSISSGEAVPTDVPRALKAFSIWLNRRVNFAIAPRRASSGSMVDRRATFTREKRRSPSSS